MIYTVKIFKLQCVRQHYHLNFQFRTTKILNLTRTGKVTNLVALLA
jgi:hypothetical protein